MRNAVTGVRAIAVLGEGSGLGTATTVADVSVCPDDAVSVSVAALAPPDTTIRLSESTIPISRRAAVARRRCG
jgi:hypothetical protein